MGLMAAAAITVMTGSAAHATLHGPFVSQDQDADPQPGHVTPPDTAPPVPEAPAAFKPVRVRFRLADGVQVRGELTAWDRDGIDGSFGPRAWTDLDLDSIWTLRRRVGDQKDAQTWFDIVRDLKLAMLDQTDDLVRGERLVDRALKQATRFADDATCAAALAAIDADVAAEKELRQKEKEAAEARKLRTLTPEAMDWRPDVWPTLTPEQHEAAVLTMRNDAQAILEKAGMQIAPIETEYFLFYSDIPRKEAAQWANDLDIMYRKLARQFAIDTDKPLFWGKAVIFVFNERERFRLVEAQAFQAFVPDWVDGICHPVGPKVFVSFFRQPRTEIFGAVLIHETTHGFMHRYRTPMRLPTWANEGIADYMASILFESSTVDLIRRRPGTRWIRRGGDINEVFDMSYVDGTWPGEEEIGYAVGYLVVDLMIKDRPREFAAWVNAIKAGKDWEQALIEDFGATREELVEAATQYFKVND